MPSETEAEAFKFLDQGLFPMRIFMFPKNKNPGLREKYRVMNADLHSLSTEDST